MMGVRDYVQVAEALRGSGLILGWDEAEWRRLLDASPIKWAQQVHAILVNGKRISKQTYAQLYNIVEEKLPDRFVDGCLVTVAKHGYGTIPSNHPITHEMIEAAKRRTKYRWTGDILHEHPDCIRIAYEWLDAQTKVKKGSTCLPLKHVIERWGDRYVSRNDVEVAAEIHPEVHGRYPAFNLSKQLVLPHRRRLATIREAGSQRYGNEQQDSYHVIEA
jgi:hypothetical protein